MNKPGQKAQHLDGQPIRRNVLLDAKTIELARKAGMGNLSLGIRVLVKNIQPSSK